MRKYLIERNIPGAHKMSDDELRAAASKSCDVLDQLGTDVRWQQSFISKDKVTCVYVARDEDIIREHARISGFPADRILEIEGEFGPATAGQRKAAAATP